MPLGVALAVMEQLPLGVDQIPRFFQEALQPASAIIERLADTKLAMAGLSEGLAGVRTIAAVIAPMMITVMDQEDKLWEKNLSREVSDLKLSARIVRCLQNAGVRYVSDLCQKTDAELLKNRNFARKSLKKVKHVLAEMGLSLGMRFDGFPRPE